MKKMISLIKVVAAAVLALYLPCMMVSCSDGSSDDGSGGGTIADTFSAQDFGGSFKVGGKSYSVLSLDGNGSYTMQGRSGTDEGTYAARSARAGSSTSYIFTSINGGTFTVTLSGATVTLSAGSLSAEGSGSDLLAADDFPSSTGTNPFDGKEFSVLSTSNGQLMNFAYSGKEEIVTYPDYPGESKVFSYAYNANTKHLYTKLQSHTYEDGTEETKEILLKQAEDAGLSSLYAAVLNCIWGGTRQYTVTVTDSQYVIAPYFTGKITEMDWGFVSDDDNDFRLRWDGLWTGESAGWVRAFYLYDDGKNLEMVILDDYCNPLGFLSATYTTGGTPSSPACVLTINDADAAYESLKGTYTMSFEPNSLLIYTPAAASRSALYSVPAVPARSSRWRNVNSAR